MYRGTTPTYTFTVPNTVDLTEASEVHVTFSKTNEELIFDKTGDDITVTAHAVEVYLTQRETLSFPNGEVLVQLNWIYTQGETRKRATTNKITIQAEKNLIDEVL